MDRMLKLTPKKFSFAGKVKNNNINGKVKAAVKKNIFYNFIHPNYILFDWEFFSRELEFE